MLKAKMFLCQDAGAEVWKESFKERRGSAPSHVPDERISTFQRHARVAVLSRKAIFVGRVWGCIP